MKPLCRLKDSGAILMVCVAPVGKMVVLDPGMHPSWVRGQTVAQAPIWRNFGNLEEMDYLLVWATFDDLGYPWMACGTQMFNLVTRRKSGDMRRSTAPNLVYENWRRIT